MCELPVGIPDVNVLGVETRIDGTLRVRVEARIGRGAGLVAAARR